MRIYVISGCISQDSVLRQLQKGANEKCNGNKVSTFKNAVRTSKVDVFKDAEGWHWNRIWSWNHSNRLQPFSGHLDDLTLMQTFNTATRQMYSVALTQGGRHELRCTPSLLTILLQYVSSFHLLSKSFLLRMCRTDFLFRFVSVWFLKKKLVTWFRTSLARSGLKKTRFSSDIIFTTCVTTE